MDTKKYIKQIILISLALSVVFILQGCPLCIYRTGSYYIHVPGLFKITPLDSVYHQGDTIIISGRIPSILTRNNTDTVDLYKETGMRKVYIRSLLYKIIDPNDYEILEGEYDNYRAYVKYYDAVDEYRFKARVILNLTGNYEMLGGIELEFPLPPPNPKCKRSDKYYVNTNIEGADTTGYIRFTVLP